LALELARRAGGLSTVMEITEPLGFVTVTVTTPVAVVVVVVVLPVTAEVVVTLLTCAEDEPDDVAALVLVVFAAAGTRAAMEAFRELGLLLAPEPAPTLLTAKFILNLLG
jgi:hypothetical protein